MKLLLDANILWRIIPSLKLYFEDVLHVENIDLQQPAKDIDIWNYAYKFNLIIISNDLDFYKLSILKGFPPKIVIIRTGNQSKTYINDLLIKHISEIENLSISTDYGILEIM